MDRVALKRKLLEIVEKETWEEYKNFDDQTELRAELELDSVDMVTLVLEIQNQFEIEIGSKDLDGVKRVGDLLDLLEGKLRDQSKQHAA